MVKGVEEEQEEGEVPTSICRPEQGCPEPAVPGIHGGAAGEEEAHHGEEALPRRVVQRPAPLLVRLLYARSALQQHLHRVILHRGCT